MRRIVLILLAIALLLALPSSALAQESARYNFASAQGNKQINVAPGGEGEGVIYFYNIDGNRITHVTLSVSQAPDNWEVEIQPPPQEIEVEVSGKIVTVTENLHVKPSEVLPEEPGDVPEGMVCVKIPSRGYVLAKAANIIVRVPESEKIGTIGDIVISAGAEWLGQSGAAVMKQERQFDFSVEVVSGSAEFTETIIGEGEKSEATGPTKAAAGEAEIPKVSSTAETPADEEDTSGFSITSWLPAIVAGVIVILGAILIPVFVARKRR